MKKQNIFALIVILVSAISAPSQGIWDDPDLLLKTPESDSVNTVVKTEIPEVKDSVDAVTKVEVVDSIITPPQPLIKVDTTIATVEETVAKIDSVAIEAKDSSFAAPVTDKLTLADSSANSEIPADSAQIIDSSKVAALNKITDSVETSDSLQTPIQPASEAIAEAIEKSNANIAKEDSIKAAIKAQKAADAKLDSSQIPLVVKPKINKQDILGPVRISKVNTIDDLKGQYRSPKQALFMSLVLPGSGQFYVGGNRGIISGAVFVVVEAVIGISWYHYTVTRFNEEVKRYEDFAQKNFALDRYEGAMHSLFEQLGDKSSEDKFALRYLGDRNDYCEALYGKAESFDCNDFTSDEEHRQNIPEGNLRVVLEEMGVNDEEELYYLIGNPSFVLGWKDAADFVEGDALGLDGDDIVNLANSEDQYSYQAMRQKSKDLSDMQTIFLGAMIVNHIVSAVDAALLAKRHNTGLYQQDLSWYQKINVDSDFSLNDGKLLTKVSARFSF